MAKTKAQYGNDSITALKGPDTVRTRPGVMLGSDGLEGCKHTAFEILSNSIDEAREGFGDKIIVTCYNDGSLEVTDFGRGIPVDYNSKEGKYNWELVFCTLYAGGKYNNNSGENYEYSLGLNGLGLCATQFTSEYMEAEIYNGEYRYILNFEKGYNVTGTKEGFIKEECKRKKTGTRIKWKPDNKVFTDVAIPREYFEEILHQQAVVNNGLLFVFRYQNKDGQFDEKEYVYNDGITDYLKEKVGETAKTTVQYWQAERKGRDRADLDEYKVKLSVVFCFSNKASFTEYYHNSSFLEHGGSTEKAVKQAFTSQIDTYLKNNNKYLKNEGKINPVDVEDCLALVSSSFSTIASYEHQTKKSITNKFIYDAMTEWLKHQLEVYFIENPDEATKISEMVLINKRSREKSEKERITIKKKLSGNIDLANRVQKFVDCRTKDLDRRELYIVEGDSALGSCKLARDAEFQAIMPVRGKILNCLKADYNKIFGSEIITDLIKVFGCGVEVTSKANKDLSMFNLNAFKWNKIVICTDADVDGFQIRTLILTMLYRLTPTLIDLGYVYIAESPLYEITTKKMTYFAYDEKEKIKILDMIGDEKYTIQRSKGLGENEPEMMNLTTMNPATRRLIKVNKADVLETEKIFDILLGDDLQGRKDYISENGYLYLDDVDVS